MDVFHIIFPREVTRMQLLDMVLACPSCATTELLAVLVSWFFPRAVRTWKYGTFSFTILYLAVTFLVFGCCFRHAEHWILREMTWSMGVMLGSTVDTYSSLVLGWLLEEFHVFLRDWADSVPEVDSRLISPCRDVRRQQRQWHISTGFAGLHAPRAMFLTLACGSAALVVNSGGGMLFLVLLIFSHFALPMNAGRCSFAYNDIAHGPGGAVPGQVQFLGMVVDTPVAYNDMVWSRQYSSGQGRCHACCFSGRCISRQGR